MWRIWKRSAASGGPSWDELERANASVFARNGGDAIRAGDTVSVPKAKAADVAPSDTLVRGDRPSWERPKVELAPASSTRAITCEVASYAIRPARSIRSATSSRHSRRWLRYEAWRASRRFCIAARDASAW